jgi:hypothetical protein
MKSSQKTCRIAGMMQSLSVGRPSDQTAAANFCRAIEPYYPEMAAAGPISVFCCQNLSCWNFSAKGAVPLNKKLPVFFRTATPLALALLIITAALLPLSGCSGNKRVGTAKYSVPSSGNVSAKTIQKIKDSGGVGVFSGKSAGAAYRWTFIGTDIKKAAAAQLAVSINGADIGKARQAAGGAEVFAFRAACQDTLPGNPSLIVEPGSKWKNGVYSLYVLGGDGQADALGDIRIQNGASMPIERSEWKGTFYITAKKAAQPAPQASSQASSQASQSQAPQEAAPVQPAQTPSVTISIKCQTALNNWSKLAANKRDNRVVPSDGVILHETTVKLADAPTVYAALVYVCEHGGIQMQHRGSSAYNSQYIAGINNLYEFDGGPLSGWMYAVNGSYPDVGCSQYQLKNGDKIQWNYTCDLGRDLGSARSTLG